MDASYKIQRGIHVHLIQFFMCPEFWVHISAPGSVFAFSHSSRLSTTPRRVAAESRRASRSAGERGISRVSSTPFRQFIT